MPEQEPIQNLLRICQAFCNGTSTLQEIIEGICLVRHSVTSVEMNSLHKALLVADGKLDGLRALYSPGEPPNNEIFPVLQNLQETLEAALIDTEQR